MEKIQEKRTKRFFMGIALILGSIVYGWIGLIVCNALAVKYGVLWAGVGWIIYALSWITYGLGFFLAGREGIVYVKKIWKRIFNYIGK